MNKLSHKTILLVEDEPLIALVEKRTLEKHGYTVVTVNTGEKAIEYMDSGDDIDLILMDIDLGEGMDGTQAAEIILRDRDIPLAFLSAHTDPETVEKTEGITSYGYILKNSGDTVLLASIRMAFRLYEAKREAVKQNMLMAAAHEQLRLSNEQLEWWPSIMEYVLRHDISAIAVLDKQLRFMYVSERFLEDYGVSYASVVGMHHYDVFPEIPQKWRDIHQRALAGETLRSDSDVFERPDGTIDYTRWECRPWYAPDGTVGGIILYTEVLTPFMQVQEELRLYAAEKVTLLKEVQHRVKNTMMTMGSLLSLQASTLQAPEAVAAINDARSRFHSMEVLYDQLYRTDGSVDSSVEEYLSNLVRTVIDLFPGGDTVQVKTEIDDFRLGMRRLSTLGMIMNELVTNSMKYAFRGRDNGNFFVGVQRKDELARVIVEDDGPGLPETFKEDMQMGFGLDMVHALTEQLGGTIRFESNGGMRALLEFEIA
ncbi:MAG: response regulator [Spirochaetaceae bacterium]|nr:MAG: response regulator [Spirochaetaceae bacterium]